MNKHAFLMQVHKEPELFGRIVKRLAAENHFFFVNVDEKTKEYDAFTTAVKDVPNVIFTKRMNVMHGCFSQVACTLEQLEELYRELPDYDYIHTLSGQDYPCVSADEFDSFFENNTRSYMMLDLEDEQREWIQNKYKERLEHWYFNDEFNKPLMRKLHIAGILKLLCWKIPRPYKNMQEVWGGVELVFTT